MRRLLLLMTTRTYRARAFLTAAGRLELPVVVGSDKPQILAGANPSGHLTLPFSEPAKAVRVIVDHASRHEIGAVVAADDEGVVLAARAAEALGLRHSSAASVTIARDKHRTREALARTGLSCPWFERVSIREDPHLLAGRMTYPCVVKPLAMSASRGVIRADDPDQFTAAFSRVAGIVRGSGAQALLVEGYLPGDEVALEGLLIDGELVVLAIFDKPDPLEGPFFEESIYVTPSRHVKRTQDRVVETTKRAIDAIGLREGPVHVELRLADEGPCVLEIAPRSIGGLCARTLRFGSGSALEELILRQAFGMPVASYERERPAAGVMMIPTPRAGRLESVEGRAEAGAVAGVEETIITVPVGGELLPPPEGERYLGFIFARAETPEDVEAALREAHGRLVIRIAPGPAEAKPVDNRHPAR